MAPLATDVWHVTSQALRALLITVTGAGWLMVLVSTFVVDHFDLFRLRQVFARLTGRRTVEHEFSTPFLYCMVSHPIYTGFIIAFGLRRQ
jgi:hypothetical protein